MWLGKWSVIAILIAVGLLFCFLAHLFGDRDLVIAVAMVVVAALASLIAGIVFEW
ncbi:hypothetical protein HB780_06110 (plasmid) [Rhizobium lusitanum]|uniref:hypothetical protein n=1 Tax=Rhizobium lusitanum TaxID=293958 RepID=UPI00160A2075|nr:hypothetical protein [Rhizobium lusitanum]QND45321.1 hypothetical protein HB780_06110 [Rhizobium lusitanum]